MAGANSAVIRNACCRDSLNLEPPDCEVWPFTTALFSELGTPGSLNLELSGARVTEFGTFRYASQGACRKRHLGEKPTFFAYRTTAVVASGSETAAALGSQVPASLVQPQSVIGRKFSAANGRRPQIHHLYDSKSVHTSLIVTVGYVPWMPTRLPSRRRALIEDGAPYKLRAQCNEPTRTSQMDKGDRLCNCQRILLFKGLRMGCEM